MFLEGSLGSSALPQWDLRGTFSERETRCWRFNVSPRDKPSHAFLDRIFLCGSWESRPCFEDPVVGFCKVLQQYPPLTGRDSQLKSPRAIFILFGPEKKHMQGCRLVSVVGYQTSPEKWRNSTRNDGRRCSYSWFMLRQKHLKCS